MVRPRYRGGEWLLYDDWHRHLERSRDSRSRRRRGLFLACRCTQRQDRTMPIGLQARPLGWSSTRSSREARREQGDHRGWSRRVVQLARSPVKAAAYCEVALFGLPPLPARTGRADGIDGLPATSGGHRGMLDGAVRRGRRTRPGDGAPRHGDRGRADDVHVHAEFAEAGEDRFVFVAAVHGGRPDHASGEDGGGRDTLWLPAEGIVGHDRDRRGRDSASGAGAQAAWLYRDSAAVHRSVG